MACNVENTFLHNGNISKSFHTKIGNNQGLLLSYPFSTLCWMVSYAKSIQREEKPTTLSGGFGLCKLFLPTPLIVSNVQVNLSDFKGLVCNVKLG